MSNKLENAKVLVIGAAGFIGGFVVSELLKEPVKEVIIYDNFTRGKMENIEDSLKDPRCSIFPYGGDVREIDVLEQLSKGLNYINIAENLFLSPATVRKHIENIYTKLQVHNKLEAVQKAKKNNLI